MGRALIDKVVLPAMLEVLQGERSDDIISAALIAVARIGAGGSDSAPGPHRLSILTCIRLHLSAPSQELSETAILSLGIFGESTSIDILLDILNPTKAGARYLGRGEVPTRSRAFAAFGLGAMAHDTTDVAVRQRIAHALIRTIEDRHTRPDVPTAAMLALGHCALPAKLTLPPQDLLSSDFSERVVSQGALVRWLLDRTTHTIQDGAKHSVQERSFHYVALARLAAKSEERLRADVLDRLLAKVSNRSEQSIERSAAILAIGEIANAGSDKRDREAVRLLIKTMKSGQAMERRFASIALARVSSRPGGGEDPFVSGPNGRRALEEMLVRGGASERPWGAIALGVQANALGKLGAKGADGASSALAEMLRKQKNASTAGAYALGLGLLASGSDAPSHPGHAKMAFKAFQRTKDPEARGHLAVCLGLLGHDVAKEELRATLLDAKFQPRLLWSSAVGLGLLQDDEVTPILVNVLATARSHSSRSAAAAALGTAGDSRAAKPLVKLAMDLARPDGTRAFAIVGLGILCEERELPWRNPLALCVPYAALTPTLMGSGAGLFDIL